MKLKGIKLNGTYKVIYYVTSFAVYDEKDNEIYFEDSNDNWEKKIFEPTTKIKRRIVQLCKENDIVLEENE